MEAACYNCPFNKTGPGAHLRRTLDKRRWSSILYSLLHDRHFLCHKTTGETGDGSNLLCAGAIEWQHKRGVTSNLERVMERLEYLFQERKTWGIMEPDHRGKYARRVLEEQCSR